MSKLQSLPKVDKFWLAGKYFQHNDPQADKLVQIVKEVLEGQGFDAKVTWKNITEISLDPDTIEDYVTKNTICEFEDNIAVYGFLVENLKDFDYATNMQYIFNELKEYNDYFGGLALGSIDWVTHPEPLLLIDIEPY